MERLKECALACALPAPLHQSHTQLRRAVQRLWETAATALGPALYFAVMLAARMQRSHVLLCTDGCANVGLGALEGHDAGSGLNGLEFYPYVAQLARMRGVIVNLLSFSGTPQSTLHFHCDFPLSFH